MNTNNAAAVDLMVSSSRLYRLIDGTADLADEKVVKEGASKDEAAKIKEKLEAAGAKVEIK